VAVFFVVTYRQNYHLICNYLVVLGKDRSNLYNNYLVMISFEKCFVRQCHNISSTLVLGFFALRPLGHSYLCLHRRRRHCSRLLPALSKKYKRPW